MNQSDQLRSQLPRLAAELDEGIEQALLRIRQARRMVQHDSAEADRAWRKGLHDALTLLRPAQDAHERFRNWMRQVIAAEVDACGLTREERDALTAPLPRE